MNEQECLDFIAKELWSGVRGMALGNVGKKRIVVELVEGEEPKACSSAVSKDAVKAGEDLSTPLRPSERESEPPRIYLNGPLPPKLNEDFYKLAKAIDEWDKRGAGSQEFTDSRVKVENPSLSSSTCTTCIQRVLPANSTQRCDLFSKAALNCRDSCESVPVV